MKALIVAILTFSSLSAFACNGSRLCPGTPVINVNGLAGTVGGVLQSGNVMVNYPGDSKAYNWNPRDLAVTKGCSSLSKKHCVGNGVINTNGLLGKISGIFPDGRVSVTYERDSKHYVWEVQDLALTMGCTRDDYCVNDQVININGLAGSISGVFINGSVALSYPGDSKHYIWNTASLAMVKACSDRTVIID